MKLRYLKSLLPAAFSASLVLGMASCVNDLDINPIHPQYTSVFNQDESFAKLYASLSLTGQAGPNGNPDIASDDEGKSAFYRSMFTANEYGTDELIWTWMDPGIPELIYIRWNSSDGNIEMLYNRIGYNITLCNYFLDKTEELTDEATVKQRAEARFLRAYYYTQFMDLFGKAPFKEHFSDDIPVQKSRSEIFKYIEDELSAIENDMYGANQAPYGRVDVAANWLLRARNYLNAEIYTGTPRWSDAATYAGKVIEDTDYDLCSNYAELFMADNGENADAKKEIIFPLAQDGIKSKSYGGSYFLVAATRIAGMPSWGTSDSWSCIRSREKLISKFFENTEDAPLTESVDELIEAANDDRALFYSGTGGGKRQVKLETVTKFTDGFSCVKWTALKSDGNNGQDVSVPDTDIPLFRLAEAYLIRAEANLRQGTVAKSEILKDINKLRKRANATLATEDDITLDYILDERSRELYYEGHRRTDLVRYDYFTTNKYLWDWKGGVAEGTSVSSIYNVYPIPDSDINSNDNMEQNEGY
ncbi:MAG: starch-binding outer membrane lipoprotein SusD [Bacteroides sp.]|nr:starch-binding outer membrane lipoprotein SusD [Bacteroides sp.]